MAEHFTRFIVPPDLVDDFGRIAQEAGALASAPQPADSTAEPLNAPLSPQDVLAAAQAITVVFTAGTSMVTFALKLIELVKQRRSAVRVVDARDPSRRAEITQEHGSDDVLKAIGDVPSTAG